jgi:hypothetical protein
MSFNCGICKSPSTFSCGACKAVHYCSREHQILHWKAHKATCFPLEIRESEALGRYLVTTRDVQQGEVILKESPLVAGPNGSSGSAQPQNGPVCLGCFRTIGKGVTYLCSVCSWPLCCVECEQVNKHLVTWGRFEPLTV